MSDVKFFETRMGHIYYEGTMPRIAKALERIAAALEKTGAAPLVAAPPEDVGEFIRRVAKFTKDQECETHGPSCDGGLADCVEFDMPNDDAVETLHTIIDDARSLSSSKERP